MRMKAASMMLVHRRLANLQQLIEKYELVVNVKLTILQRNLADKLMRVPKRWLATLKQGSEPLTYAALMNKGSYFFCYNVNMRKNEMICSSHQQIASKHL